MNPNKCITNYFLAALLLCLTLLGLAQAQNDEHPKPKVALRSKANMPEPLYVVDGLVYDSARLATDSTLTSRNPLEHINPEDIDNITILKGDAATKLYGTKGSKGVVVVLTKTQKK